MQTIEYDDALRALNQAVADKGYGYVYPRDDRPGGSCFNVWEGNPDCIVGHALVWLGVPVEWFTEAREGSHWGRENDSAYDVCTNLAVSDMFNVTDEARDLLAHVQRLQDEGVPWGEAVTMAHLSVDVFEALRLNENVAA